MVTAYVIMGVSGSGKTTVGRALAAALGCPFLDGDDFHPPENVAKMARGIPLTDADRAPWLRRLATLIEQHLEERQDVVMACSALKRAYRQVLRVDERVRFVFLHGEFDLLQQRLEQREGHFMQADMLESQLAALEVPAPDAALHLSVRHDVDTLVRAILRAASAP